MIPLTLLKFWREGLIAVLLIGIGVQQARVAGEKADHADTRREHAEMVVDLNQKALKAVKEALATAAARQDALDALDSKFTKELDDARKQNRSLADAVRAGDRRLRLAAACPVPRADVPQAPGATGMADAQEPRLTPAAERHYFDLRDGIITAEKQIAGLQEYIRDVCLR